MLDAGHVDRLMVLVGECSRSVVRVLRLHTDVGSLVDCDTSVRFFARADCHVQVEGCVNFVLAVLDAGLLSWRLC